MGVGGGWEPWGSWLGGRKRGVAFSRERPELEGSPFLEETQTSPSESQKLILGERLRSKGPRGGQE